MIKRNTGDPINAVITPIGSSWGANAVRAAVSAAARKMPPASADVITSHLCDTPESFRMICGMINPTNPMMPDYATTTETASEEMPMTAR